MNYQQLIPEEVLNLLIEKMKAVQIPAFSEYSYFAYPYIFPSTSGPREVIGGSAITCFTVHVYELDNGFTIYVCAGCYIICEEGFDFDKRNSLSGWKRIPEVRLKNALPE